MKKNLPKKFKKYLPIAALPLILLVCAALWVSLPEEYYSSVYTNDGVWDLRGFDFENTIASLHGKVESLPLAFLAPEEFFACALCGSCIPARWVQKRL